MRVRGLRPPVPSQCQPCPALTRPPPNLTCPRIARVCLQAHPSYSELLALQLECAIKQPGLAADAARQAACSSWLKELGAQAEQGKARGIHGLEAQRMRLEHTFQAAMVRHRPGCTGGK